MNEPTVETASWIHEYELIVDNGGQGVASGSGWYTAGDTAPFSINPTTVVDGSTQYMFLAWYGDSSSTSASDSIAMNAPKTVTATWTNQFLVQYIATGATLTVAVPADQWVNANSVVPGIFPNSVTDGAGNRCDYVADNRPAAVTGPTTVTANYQTWYFLTVNNGGHSTVGGEGWYTSGATTQATITDQIADELAGTRYNFKEWTIDAFGSSLTSSEITMNAPKTATATWTIQYYLTVQNGGYGVEGGSGWYNSGTTAFASLDRGIVASGPGERNVFTSWGTDASGTNYAISNDIVMNGPKTALANWHTEYQVTFAQSGVDTDFAGTVITVNGLNYDRDGYSAWYDLGESVDYSYQNTLSVDGGKQYAKTSSDASPLVVSSSITVVGSYKTQFLVTFAHSGLSNDATGTIVTIEGNPAIYSDLPFNVWVDAFTGSLSYSYAPTVSSSTLGKQYVQTTIDSSPVTGLSGPVTIAGMFKTQWEVTFIATGLDIDAGSNIVLTVGSNNYVWDTLPSNLWVDENTVFSWTDPVSGGASKQFVKTGESGITSPITASGTASAAYMAEVI